MYGVRISSNANATAVFNFPVTLCFSAGAYTPASPKDFSDPVDSWRFEQKWSDGSMEFLSQPSSLGDHDHFFGQVAELEKLLHADGMDNHACWPLTDQGDNMHTTDSLLLTFGSGKGGFDDIHGEKEMGHLTDESLSSNPTLLADSGGESSSLEDFQEVGQIFGGEVESVSLTPSPESTNDYAKALEKRKRNNEASRKFRRKRKSTHQRLFAKAQKLESDNHILKVQVEELLKELGTLKASMHQALILCK